MSGSDIPRYGTNGLSSAQIMGQPQMSPTVHAVEGSYYPYHPTQVVYPYLQTQSASASVAALTSQNLVDAVTTALRLPLSAHHDQTLDRFDVIQKSIQALTESLERVDDQARERTDQILRYVQNSNEAQNKRMKSILDRVDKLSRVIGASTPDDSHITITDSLHNIDCNLQDLVERIADPEAFHPQIVKHEIGTSPHIRHAQARHVDAAVDARVGEESPRFPRRTVSIAGEYFLAKLGENNAHIKFFPDETTETDSIASSRSNEIHDAANSSHRGDFLNLQSFVDQPNMINAGLLPLQSRFHPHDYSPEPLVPVNWSGSGTAVAGNAPRSASPNPQEDDTTVAALRQTILGSASGPYPLSTASPEQDAPRDTGELALAQDAGAPEQNESRGEEIVPPQVEEPNFPSFDIQVLPSPPITQLTQTAEDGASPSRMVSPSLGHESRSYSPSLSSLSTMSSDVELEKDVQELRQRGRVSMPLPKTTGGQEASIQPIRRTARGRISMPPRRIADAFIQSSSKSSSKKRKYEFDPTKPAKRHRKQSTSKAKGKGREVLCKWPEKTRNENGFDRQFIQCDNCNIWYHYCCVGIVEGDLRLLDASEAFMCPRCNISEKERTRRQGKHSDHNLCGRPDCDRPGDEIQTNEYFVEKIVGRRPKHQQGGSDPAFLWLVKWDGYPMSEAYWLSEEDIGGLGKLIEDFEDAALEENLDLEASISSQVLLREAAVVGARSS